MVLITRGTPSSGPAGPQAADAHEPKPPPDGHATRMICRPPMEISGIPTSGGRASTSRCGPTTSAKPPREPTSDSAAEGETEPDVPPVERPTSEQWPPKPSPKPSPRKRRS